MICVVFVAFVVFLAIATHSGSGNLDSFFGTSTFKIEQNDAVILVTRSTPLKSPYICQQIWCFLEVETIEENFSYS